MVNEIYTLISWYNFKANDLETIERDVKYDSFTKRKTYFIWSDDNWKYYWFWRENIFEEYLSSEDADKLQKYNENMNLIKVKLESICEC